MSDEAAVRDQMGKILESAGFRNSDRLRRFLRYTVEAKLRGEDGQIKEYLLGREVFDRDAEYDPRLDPIVRVEARRLRQKLDEFYAASPVAPGGLRIEFPKGSYAPEFRRVETPAGEEATPPKRDRRWVFGAVAAALAAIGLLWLRSSPAPRGLLAVVPAHWMWSQQEFPQLAYDEDLAELTAAELANRHAARVAAWPLLQKYRSGGWSAGQIASGLGADRVLLVAVRQEANGLRVTGYLLDPKANRKLGVFDASQQKLTTLEERRKVAHDLAAAVIAMF